MMQQLQRKIEHATHSRNRL